MFMQFSVFLNSGIAQHVLSAKLRVIQITQLLFVEVLVVFWGFFASHAVFKCVLRWRKDVGTLVFTGRMHLAI